MCPSTWRRLHKPPSPEGPDILWGEFEPLAVATSVCKPRVPVALDAARVISRDGVDLDGRVGELNGKLVASSADVERMANLEVSP